ncbi:nuclear transport factor 2 family protein [Altibacter sp.]|uniref:nuclear transport factor 2 family protein n=1 Tax=Altibacter sp. TaxID=2024823 RepID=UPI000C93C14D|nr:nuclear transport factor 2 family protein [Altibacter sp.]MAP54454.1 hypothetical protein [Altibacter sp.]
MKVDKKIQTEVFKVYDTWLHAYLNGDVATYDAYLDDDFHFIGSTNNEEFLNRAATTQFFAETAEQLAGKCDLRNETKIMDAFDDLVFINHFFDAWFQNGTDWNYYGRFRFTNVLRKNNEGWRFVYQHYSTPDSKTDAGETIGFDKIHVENQELREAIKRRTFELEQKNRELEVEGALQRIRAQAVAMKESTDLLDIVVTMRNEFIKLGHDAHYFWHMMWRPDTYEKAMTSGDGSKIGFVMELPRHIHGDIPQLAKWEKSKKPTVVYAMGVEDALDYVGKMVSLGDFKNIDPQAPTEDDIRHIGGLTFIMARTTHGEIGYSLPGVVKKPPTEDIEILIKFAGAFDLAHRRFLDLKKAEKQAREIQIELALEKVRSRTMAMQHSDELPVAANVLFTEVQSLGVPAWSCGYNILFEDKKSSTCIMSSEGELQEPFVLPLTKHKSLRPWHKAIVNGDDFFVYGQESKELVEHYNYMKSLPELKGTFEQFEKANIDLPTTQFNHLVRFNKGFLLFITYEVVPEAHDIFKRFGKVFEQTYTRFLDLQKAEKQAREAQIEAALERTRTQSMLMQHSNELDTTSKVFHQQLLQLGIESEFSYVWLPDIENKKHKFWATWTENTKSSSEIKSQSFTYDLDRNEPYTAACFEAWESGEAVHIVPIPPEEVQNFFSIWSELLSGAKNLKAKNFPEGLYYAEAYMKYGCFGINIRRTLTKDEQDI